MKLKLSNSWLACGIVAIGMGSVAHASTVAGAVNSDGTVQGSPTSFHVSHPSTGRYIITFNPALAPSALCVFTPIPGPARVAGLGVNSTTCDVTFVKGSTKGGVLNTLFTFIAANSGP